MLIAKPLFEASAVVEGFGWNPVFENSEVAFYQMNGLMLGTWQKKMLEEDMRRKLDRSGVFALAHLASVLAPSPFRKTARQLALRRCKRS